ncbi:AAA family ATPase [Candidatus Woesearchaeota archaeon CG11_big_fil_rev_8_21_14_0_20_43_8]|nr:MAG: AAA family ATPase [Candidatus Woesearchaeota archaeon CG11_big_fil_rev_8_21_14_0_20_43_8]PIO04668.1 MAG: AAA family ATPase [Candidatus Woesearchaeota archaeon CG08_land_8_20_14_0_20_43_7]
MADDQKNMKLIAAEAVQTDVGRSVVRMSDKYMEELSLNNGDTISIKGKDETVATVWRARPEDEFLDIIRMDGVLRYNAQTSVGEKVEVKKIKCQTATQVTLAPIENLQFSGNVSHYFHQRLLDKPLLKGNKVAMEIMGKGFYFVVTQTQPKGYTIINESTKVQILDKAVDADSIKAIPEVTYEDIGGLKEEIEQIREMIELPMKHPEVFERLGIGAPKGVLLTGPPGTGKTLLAKAVASETDSSFYSIQGPEIMSKFYGESEKHIRDIFEEAHKNAPSIIFIDEIDAIAPKREETKGEVERRVVAQILTLMDGLKSRGEVVVIAATNRAEALDPALRRPGRFDRELVINVPDYAGRKDILLIHTRGMPLAKDVDKEKLAEITIGYTGADLEVLCKEAAMKSLKKYIPSLKEISEKVPTNVLEKIEVKMEHFLEAFKRVEPSAMREVLIRKPKVSWSDIGGLKDIKQKMKENIEWPLDNPEDFKKIGIKPPKGILLYGPPGCGKTLMAKAIANEINANFISIKGPELISKWVGESEKHIRDIFKKARQVAPAIIFFDEFDSISKVRGGSLNDSTERMVNQLLTELDGVEELEKVFIIAATNRPDLIDPGLLRAGRIDLKMEIPLPDEAGREAILKVHTKDMPIVDIDLLNYSRLTDGFSGAEIESLCKKAGMAALRESKKKGNKDIKVRDKHFREALDEINKEKPFKDDKESYMSNVI